MDSEARPIPTPRWRRLTDLEPPPDTDDYGIIEEDDAAYIARHSVLAKRERAGWDIARGSAPKKRKLALKYPAPTKCQQLVENALNRARELAAGAPTAARDTAGREALNPSLTALCVVARLDKAVARAKRDLGDLPSGPLHAAIHTWLQAKVDDLTKNVSDIYGTVYRCFGNMLPQVGWAPTTSQAGIKKLLATTQNAVDTADECVEVPATEEQTELFADFLRDELRSEGYDLVADSFKLRPGYLMDGDNGATVYPVQTQVPDEHALVENGLRIDARWVDAAPNLKNESNNRVYPQHIPRKSASGRSDARRQGNQTPQNAVPPHPVLRSSPSPIKQEPQTDRDAMLHLLANRNGPRSNFQTPPATATATTTAAAATVTGVPKPTANGVRHRRKRSPSSSDTPASLRQQRQPVRSNPRRTRGSPSGHGSGSSSTIPQPGRTRNVIARKTASDRQTRRR